MSIQTRLLRLLGGLIVLVTVLVVGFAVLMPAAHTWGATAAEVAQPLPGDELTDNRLIAWTHGITIDAPPEDVWPWIIQMGDDRGAFYSYTFIENRVGSITGAADYTIHYVNADRVHPEWQDPAIGQSLIEDTLYIRDYRPGEYLLADTGESQDFIWTWLWAISPLNGGRQTRLVVRCNIQIAGLDNPAATFLMDAGGFVMEQNMLQGIKARAEGYGEPANVETIEIFLWFAALFCGLGAGVLFLVRREWPAPLALGAAAVVTLLVLTIVQPPLGLRALLDALLLAWLVSLLSPVWLGARRPAGQPSGSPSAGTGHDTI